ncbi:hypothetical protein BEN49_17980 [Hymenobacter coccineus]|uniref:Phage integrase SAM-like domain-containing protein n=2 Tax=Hymenobacter coccineus TaxID=1908235 RepID=A0A1G1TM14_9BACT|nr:hypothetical protein BEN49_17980 [Hymenobacter coccineus]
MQVIINAEVWFRNLDLAWPEWLFNDAQGVCLAALPPADRPADYPQLLAAAAALFGGTPKSLAKRASEHNLLIGQALAKANKVQVDWRLSEQVMTLERFKRDFETSGSKTDFVAYFRDKIIERHRKGKISDTTRKNHFSTLNALAAFRAVVPFNTLTTEFADDFNRYLEKNVNAVNTRWCRHRDVKTYLAQAKEDKLRFDDPYRNFKNRDEPGKWKPLKTEELAKLEHYYRLCGAPHGAPPHPGQVPLQLLVQPAPGRPQAHRRQQGGEPGADVQGP